MTTAPDAAVEDPRALTQRVRRRMNDLLANKHGDAEIFSTIEQMGMPTADAAPILEQVKVQRVVAKKRNAIRGMTIGALSTLLGGAALIGILVSQHVVMNILGLPVLIGGYLLVTNFNDWRSAKP